MSYQLLTKNNRPVVYRSTKLPIYTKTVEKRIQMIRNELNQGLSKSDSAWNNILRDVKLRTA